MLEARVMIVEDEVIVAEDLRQVLESAGYTVSGHAMVESEAVEMACDLRPDVILMDVFLADGSDGLEAARAIQRAIDTSIVFVSAHSDDSIVSTAVKSGAFGYIVKPFQPGQITSSIEVALSRRMDARTLQWQRESRTQFPLVPLDAGKPPVSDSLHEDGNHSQLMIQRLQVLLSDEGGLSGIFDGTTSTVTSTAAITNREWEIIRGLLGYRRLPQVAELLGISLHTARNHLRSIFRKLDVHSQEDMFRVLLERADS